MKKYLVEVDRMMCQGFGACVELCPDSFYLSEVDGKTRLVGSTQNDTEEERDQIEVSELGCYKQAEQACPFNAIKVKDI